jgi:predicted regulator of Ras-like GTPase activity (Roadblock/LC7/MglB family)
MTPGSDNIGYLGVEDVRQFDELLGSLVTTANVHSVYLCDRTGRLLSSAGDTAGIDHTTFASLASADFSASDQLAALLGEEEFTSLYHHGAERSMFLADIGGTAILAILFDTRTTLGMVRIKTKSLVPRFAEQLQRMAQRGPSGNVVQMDANWASETESEIDRLFSDM